MGQNMQDFLSISDVIDFEDSAIRLLATELACDESPVAIAARCFCWVRDHIRHSIDHGDQEVTISASDVLRYGTGLCYAKCHLLAALLRANRIPCGFVYQRLALNEQGTSFCLHGLNAVWLPEYGWYRVDPRGNRDGIVTSFDPPQEHFAFATTLPGEGVINEIHPQPMPVVISTMRRCRTMTDLCSQLPDLEPAWSSPQTPAVESILSGKSPLVAR